jgi:23S rRNA pseudouridine2457 synthase
VEQSLFDAVGGEEFFVKLVDGFYVGIETDEVLRPMYVDQDLTESRRHLTLFLQQYWGGPSIYQAERGHPRLRMRQRLLSDLLGASSLSPATMAIGRLDQDSEGLLLLTTDGSLSHFITKSRQIEKEYYAQIEGEMGTADMERLAAGGVVLSLKGGESHLTRPCKVCRLDEPPKLPLRRSPHPGLKRKKMDGTILETPTSWIALTLIEGKFRQVRRMTASVGHPTLRLVRVRVGDLLLGDLVRRPGEVVPWRPDAALLERAHEFCLAKRAAGESESCDVGP